MNSRQHFEPFVDATDEALMLRVRDHSCLQSYRRLYEAWGQRIHRLCYRMTGSWQDGEDLTQDVFTKLFDRRSSYAVKAKFSTYVWQIAVNHCRDFARKSKRIEERQRELVQHIESSQSSNNSLDEVKHVVELALLELPVSFREVLVMRHYENLKFQEIADLLDTPRGTIASRMAKALRMMGDRLAAHGVRHNQA